VLVVQENSGRFRGTGIWKIPTGVVEEVCDLVREFSLPLSIHNGAGS